MNKCLDGLIYLLRIVKEINENDGMIYKEDLLVDGNKKLRWRRTFGKIMG